MAITVLKLTTMAINIAWLRQYNVVEGHTILTRHLFVLYCHTLEEWLPNLVPVELDLLLDLYSIKTNHKYIGRTKIRATVYHIKNSTHKSKYF